MTASEYRKQGLTALPSFKAFRRFALEHARGLFSAIVRDFGTYRRTTAVNLGTPVSTFTRMSIITR